jgi:sugar lactone lactonase YvrE
MIAFLATTAAVLGSTGQLGAKGCIADPANNVDKCAQTALGLDYADAVAVSPDGRSVYALGAGDNAIVRFKSDRTTGALTPKECVADQTSNPDGCAKTAKGLAYPDAVAVSPDGKSVYVASYDDNAIARFSRNKTTGALKAKGCVGEKGDNPANCSQTAVGLHNAESLAVSPNNNSVYAGGDVSALVRFKRSKATGALTPKGCVSDPDDNFVHCAQHANGLDFDVAVGVSANGKSLYAGGASDSAIVTFKRNRNTGALKRKGGCIADATMNPGGCAETTTGLNYVDSIAVSPDGTSVYVTALNSGALVRFKRDKATGGLTPKGCLSGAGCGGGGVPGLSHATSVAVSPDSKSVYVTGHDSNAIVRFDRKKSTGALTTKQCIANPVNNPDGCVETDPGLDGSFSVAVSPNGKSVYVAGGGDNAVVRFDRAL